MFSIIRPGNKNSFLPYFIKISKEVNKNKKMLQKKLEFDCDHIEFIKRITITPSGPIYSLQDPEMSNRLLRMFQSVKECFIR